MLIFKNCLRFLSNAKLPPKPLSYFSSLSKPGSLIFLNKFLQNPPKTQKTKKNLTISMQFFVPSTNT